MSDPSSFEPTSAAAGRRTGQAYLLFTVSLLLVVTVGTVVQSLSAGIGLAFTELALILLPAVLFVRWKRLAVAEALGWRPVPPADALLGLAVGVTSWGVAGGLYVVLQSVLGEPPATDALQPQTVPHLLWILVCAALLPGLCEETLFRGAIQGVLSRNGPRKSVLITALLFALYHVSPWLFLPALFLGLVFGTLAVRTGSTVPAILAHVATNTMAFSVAYVYRDQTDAAAYLLMAGLSAAWCVVFPVFWLRTRGADPGLPALAAVPAGLQRTGAWIVGLAGGTLMLLVVAVFGAAFVLVDVYTVASDDLEPDFQRGDRLVLFKSGLVALDLEADDLVSCTPDGQVVLRRVARIEGDDVWIYDGTVERRLPRKEIAGKVVHVLKAPDP